MNKETRDQGQLQLSPPTGSDCLKVLKGKFGEFLFNGITVNRGMNKFIYPEQI